MQKPDKLSDSLPKTKTESTKLEEKRGIAREVNRLSTALRKGGNGKNWEKGPKKQKRAFCGKCPDSGNQKVSNKFWKESQYVSGTLGNGA